MTVRMMFLTSLTLLSIFAGRRAAGSDWVAVAPDVLDGQRGGFTTTSGLHISLGVQRLVSINGTPVAQVSLQALSGGASGVSVIDGSARLIQQGGNNLFGAALDVPGATFIQNSLSGQTIRTETHITANLNSAALLRDLNFFNSMRDVTLSSSGAR